MRRVGRLTARQVEQAKPKGDRRASMFADGGGLYLQATSGRDGGVWRSWVFRYELDGQRHDVGLGPLYSLGLAEARIKARTLRQQLLDGIDPLAARQQARADRQARLAERARALTFKVCAEACIAAHEDGWRNAEHRRQWRTTLEQYAYPVLGDLAVDDIGTPHVIKVLEPIWKTKPETASRTRGRIERVLAWATVRGFRSGDNPARWRGHLQEMFPAKGKIQRTAHHAALPYIEVPALMAKLREVDHIAARALEFTILTAARTGEVIGAKWTEFDIKARTWIVPASRMKAGKEHRVPLSDNAVEIATNLPRHGARVFAIRGVAMLQKLRELHATATVHGFRSSFRDWAAERTSHPPAVAEQALAHAIDSKVMRAYHRTDLFEKRRRLMADWAHWCSRPPATTGEVVTLRGMS